MLAGFGHRQTHPHPMAACLPFCCRSPQSKLVRLLEVGLIFNSRDFPAFRVAFEPAAVKWDVDPAPYVKMASDASVQGVSG